tara:strand:+ start:435 stop:1283 length:849 start_codon:yes stop_codon:yes gene_type:complete
MSKIFKRPMFRKGGDVGGGIMDNVVERGQYANSNIKDLSIDEKIKMVEGLGGSDKGLGDPLTQFLLSVGPNIATQTGKGGFIPNVLEASKEPIGRLIKDASDRRKTRQAIGLEFIKDLSDSDKIALQEKIEYLMSEEGGGFSREEAFNRVLPEFRKSKSPTDIARDEQSLKIKDIIDVTSTRTGPTLTTNQANLIYNDELRLQKANPDAYNKFLRTSSKDKYIYGADEYQGDLNSESGATLKEGAILDSLPENTYLYDITTGNFIYRQGKKVFKLDLDIQEE